MSGQPGAVQWQTGTDVVRVRFDAFDLDEANASLLREGKPVALAPTPFAVRHFDKIVGANLTRIS